MYNVIEFTVNINTHFTYYMKDKGSWYGIYDDICTADVWKKTLADALEIQHLKCNEKHNFDFFIDPQKHNEATTIGLNELDYRFNVDVNKKHMKFKKQTHTGYKLFVKLFPQDSMLCIMLCLNFCITHLY